MNIIGINTLVYMDALRDGATQSELLGSIAELGVTLAEVRRKRCADQRSAAVLFRSGIHHSQR